MSFIMKINKRLFLKKICIIVLIILELVLLLAHFAVGNGQHRTSLFHATQPLANNVQAVKKRQDIQLRLNRYLKRVTRDKTVSVSFYNLGPLKNSPAAKSKLAATYQPGKLQAEYHARQPKTAASTYKLFIAAYLFRRAVYQDFTWTPELKAGFREMIVYSANDFPEAMLKHYGLDSINQFIKDQQWYAPVFQSGKISKTTTYSLQLLLMDLVKGHGAFTNAANRNTLLKLMRQQKYRAGIPKGAAQATAGTTVADKVGFLKDTNNDAGIVTLPNGQRYILVIFTHGHHQHDFSGFKKIANITKHVQTIVYSKQ